MTYIQTKIEIFTPGNSYIVVFLRWLFEIFLAKSSIIEKCGNAVG